MLKKILFLLLALSTPLVAGFENHLKKITNKYGNHQIDNIDFIYLINLDRRPEKLERTLEQLKPYGIYPYRFSAIDGWKLSLETINELGYQFQPGVGDGIMATWYPLDGKGKPFHEEMSVPGRTYFCHCTARGTIGILLSYLSVLQDAYESGYEVVWIMEDDIEVLKNPHLISTMIEKLNDLVGPHNWDLLFTDQDAKSNATGEYVPCQSHAWRPFFHGDPSRFTVRKKVSADFRKIGARYGTHSLIIRRSGIRKILNFLKKRGLFLPIDMEYTLPEKIQLYCTREDIVSNLPGSASDNGTNCSDAQ